LIGVKAVKEDKKAGASAETLEAKANGNGKEPNVSVPITSENHGGFPQVREQPVLFDEVPRS